MKLKGVVFDLDDTLFDRYATFRSYRAPAFEALAQWMEEGVTEEQFGEALEYADRRLSCYGWYTIMGHLQERRILRRDKGIDEVIQIICKRFQAECAVPFSFQNELLNELKGMGLKLGLITNGHTEVQQKKIDLLGLTPLLDEIMISDTFKVQKPDPFLFEEMARRLAAEPGQLLYVGDHPINDYSGSKNAGYIPVLVRPSGFDKMPEAADAENKINSVAELPDLIRRNQWN